MWLLPDSLGHAALPAQKQGSEQGKAGSCGGVKEGMCKGGFSGNTSCNFNLVRVGCRMGALPDLLPPKGAGLHPVRAGISLAAPQSLGKQRGGWGGRQGGVAACCRPGAEHAGRGESL